MIQTEIVAMIFLALQRNDFSSEDEIPCPPASRSLASLGPSDKVDAPWSSRIFIHDVRKPLPFPAGSAEAICSSHLLEHLYFREGKTLVRECFRVLASKGVLRVRRERMPLRTSRIAGIEQIEQPSRVANVKASALSELNLTVSRALHFGAAAYRLAATLCGFQ